jgi:hypothetical protein
MKITFDVINNMHYKDMHLMKADDNFHPSDIIDDGNDSDDDVLKKFDDP